jgi:hypothetical protein
MFFSKTFNDSLGKTLLGVGPSKGGLSVVQLKEGLSNLNKASEKDAKLYYQKASRTTRRVQGKRRVNTLKKNDLLQCLKPHVTISPRLKADLGLEPYTQVEQKAFQLSKDSKLNYKWKSYMDRINTPYTGDWQEEEPKFQVLELLTAITNIQSRRKAHSLALLPLPRKNPLINNVILLYPSGSTTPEYVLMSHRNSSLFKPGGKPFLQKISETKATQLKQIYSKILHLPLPPHISLILELPCEKNLE